MASHSCNAAITPEIRLQYEVEKELAAKLRSAGREERLNLYPWAYAELFRRLPAHPTLKMTADDIRRDVAWQMSFLKRFLVKDAVMLEIGPGNCALSFEAAGHVGKVIGIDIVEKMTTLVPRPGNFELIVCDGISFSLPDASIDLAYSNQVIEHLHPDDALEQTRRVCRALVPGGAYVCVAPNRLTGPHDVSAHFDPVAACLHLKEYTATELRHVFRTAGFSRTVAYGGLHGRYAAVPNWVIAAAESALDALPHSLCRTLAHNLPIRMIEGVRLVGIK